MTHENSPSEALSDEYHNTTEYKALVARIKSWQNAAHRQTIEPSDDQ